MPLEEVPYVNYMDENNNPVGRILATEIRRSYNGGFGNYTFLCRDNNREFQTIYYQPNETFEATLKFVYSHKSGFIVEDETGHNRYQILNSELLKVVNTHEIIGGTMVGVWTIIKIGQAYSLRLIRGVR